MSRELIILPSEGTILLKSLKSIGNDTQYLEILDFNLAYQYLEAQQIIYYIDQYRANGWCSILIEI